MSEHPLKHRSFETWDITSESLEDVERRIHDGVPLEHLRGRARGYVKQMRRQVEAIAPRPGHTAMEIGSGVGYIMEAYAEAFRPERLLGLDVAPGMIAKARERLTRDGVDSPAFDFALYDGVTFPFEAGTFDFVYSVASLQHVPRPYVFRVLGETMRVLKSTGAAYFHFLSIRHLARHESAAREFLAENLRQIENRKGHWHHYYTAEELVAIARHALDAWCIDVIEEAGSLYLSFTRSGAKRFAGKRARRYLE